MEKSPTIPPNFVTLRDLKERREREQKLKLQQSVQVEKGEESEVKRPLIAPVHIKEEKQEGYSDNFPPKPPKYTTNQNRSRGRGHPKKSAIIGAKAGVKESTSLKHTTNQNRTRGWVPPKQSTIIGVQAAANGSTSNAEKKKESDAEVAGVITELSLTGLNCGSEVAMGEKRAKTTTALVNGGKTGGRVALDIERRISGSQINGRISGSQINGRISNAKRGGQGIGGGRGYGNNWHKSSSSIGKVWVAKKSLNQKDDVVGNK